MEKYIFLTTEGLTYQPNSASSEPDIENMQVIGFGQGDTVQDALRKLLELNEYLSNTNFDEIFAIQLANDHRDYFFLRDISRSMVEPNTRNRQHYPLHDKYRPS